ncbi:MAG TPA: DUF2182 domain-containing protein [Oscillatoriales cyanobacterium M59_W2019_021]|nr:DUF2182 domain-containing protein [Oscillatoriales cyanobacterium M4454_W2019_049]HIK52653.1 DUF2182 domain-containing protein [Oscillatoriales cyanobacterium M59_W2019_021]
MALGEWVERFLKDDRRIVLVATLGVAAIAWIYLIVMAAGMHAPTIESMVQLQPWTLTDTVLMFLMWAVMMVAMMVPSATPTILLYARVCRQRGIGGSTLPPTGAFLLGYLAVWTGFSFVATVLQWGLERAALLSPMMVSTSPVFGGLLAIAAGLYQFVPYKSACLQFCRSPVEFLSTHWKHGDFGTFRMGIDRGLYCLGCCWGLMMLLFLGGVMNLLWIAAISLFVLVEKVAPWGDTFGRIGAVFLLVWGLALMLLPFTQ